MEFGWLLQGAAESDRAVAVLAPQPGAGRAGSVGVAVVLILLAVAAICCAAAGSTSHRSEPSRCGTRRRS